MNTTTNHRIESEKAFMRERLRAFKRERKKAFECVRERE
jgi:hypothetical protein